MRWREVALTVEPELAEAVADVLGRYARSGASVSRGAEPDPASDLIVRAYYPDDESADATDTAIREALWHLSQIRPVPEPEIRVIDEEDWAESWKALYRPLLIGERLIILPAWERIDPGPRIPVYLDPGMAFGTGAHPTTRMCLVAIERSLGPGDLVVDLGCGSGILAASAARLGARRVLACDIDPEAVAAATRTAEANGLSDLIEVYPGSLAETQERLDALGDAADLVVVNILAGVVEQLLVEGLARTVASDGLLVVSGLLAEQAASVVETAGRQGLRLAESHHDADWRALWLTR